jgi:Tfp pilus assembly ATPase PilU
VQPKAPNLVERATFRMSLRSTHRAPHCERQAHQMALDARDELLVLLWRDGKLSYEDALRYSTSTNAARGAVRAAQRDGADTPKATPTGTSRMRT